MFWRQKKIIVTASEAGTAAFCPHVLYLKYSGHKVSKEAQILRNNGTLKHREINLGVDRRCFVATYIYGTNDPITWNLRWYRDEVLMPHWFGRGVVRTYYCLSPYLIKIARRYPYADRLLKTLFTNLVDRSCHK